MDSTIKINKAFTNINKLVLLTTIILLPTFLNPFTANLFTISKHTLLALSASLLVITWMVRHIVARNVRVTITPFTLPLIFLTLIQLVSNYTSLPTFVESFVNTTSPLLFLTLIFIVGSGIKSTKTYAHTILKLIATAGVLLAIATILEAVKLGPTALMAWIFSSIDRNNGLFLSPAGSVVALLTYLIPALIISLFLAFDSKKTVERALMILSGTIITSALVICVFTILPGKPNTPIFIPFYTSWQIAAENIKSPKAFLIGSGANNYITAFSTNRDPGYNLNDFWNIRFNSGRNEPLHIFTTTGLVGLVAWVWFVLGIFKVSKQAKTLSSYGKISLTALGIILIINLIIPSSLVIWGLTLFLTLAIIADLKNQKSPLVYDVILKLFTAKKIVDTQKTEEPNNSNDLFPLVLGIPAIILMLGLDYLAVRATAADQSFRQSLEATVKNDGTKTYDLQRQAIRLNPFNSTYRRVYAGTNLALANAISQKENPSDQDKTNISQLIQQAIQEGKSAAVINANDPTNWETLSGIYSNIINVAEGAKDWTIASYTETIRRDPINPRLRLELGGIFFQLKDYSSAADLFSQAINLKPDWANAYYNLAVTYKEAGNLESAVAVYDKVLSLVDPTSNDYTKAQEEQNALKQQLGEKTKQPENLKTSELTSPKPLPTKKPQAENINLGEDAAPPVTPQNPSPSGDQPEATPTP